MEQDGIVSVWAGFFEDEASLMAYAPKKDTTVKETKRFPPLIRIFSVVTRFGLLTLIFGNEIWLNPLWMWKLWLSDFLKAQP